MDSKKITIVLFGRTGAGKSFLANEILGQRRFPVGDPLSSCTRSVDQEEFQWPFDPSIQVKIVDTPGFADSRPEMIIEVVLSRILSFLKNEGEIHIPIWCLQASPILDGYHFKELKMLQLFLGQNLFDHIIFAVTQENRLKEEEQTRFSNIFAPNLLEKLRGNGLPIIAQDRILSANPGTLQDLFLPKLTELIQQAHPFRPHFPAEIDPNDLDSIKIFLLMPKIKEYLRPYTQEIDQLKDNIKKLERENIQLEEKNKKSIQKEVQNQIRALLAKKECRNPSVAETSSPLNQSSSEKRVPLQYAKPQSQESSDSKRCLGCNIF